MKRWINIFKVFILIIAVVGVTFEAQLYILFKQQRTELDAVKSKLDVEAEFNTNKFKYQEDRIENLIKDLGDAQQQIKDQEDALNQQKEAIADQKDALAQESEKRQQIEDHDKGIQKSLVDITAQVDAIKQDMKGWQKDYVGVLADLEKKMDTSQQEIKDLESNLTALNIPELKKNINTLKAELEKLTQPSDNEDISMPTAPVKQVEHQVISSQ